MTLEDFVRSHAKANPGKLAVVCGDERCSYGELVDRMEARARHFQTAEKLVVFRSSQSIDFVVTYLALHAAACVAIPVENDFPEDKFAELTATTSSLSASEGVADVLFTTGTTGKQKGVMVGHAAIVANAENLIAEQGFKAVTNFIVCGPVNHIGCLSKIYTTLIAGGTLYLLEGLKDLNALFATIEAVEGNVGTFLVPASIRMISQFAAKRLASCAEKIDFIETGAAPIALADMKRLCELVPNARLYNTYASTESGIVATYDYNHGECVAGCLGKPLRHSQIAVDGQGRVVVSGPTLMTGYLGDAALTATIIYNGALHTADLGKIDDSGRLHLVGRDDDVINVGGYKVSPSEVEDMALSMPQIADCICVAAEHPVVGKVLKLLVVPAKGSEYSPKDIARYLKGRLEAYKVPMLYEQVAAVARTYNGKLNRKHYR